MHAGLTMATGEDPTSGRRCSAQAKAGKQCRGWARQGSDPPLCSAHSKARHPAREGRRCTAVTRAGQRCQKWAIQDTEAIYGQLLCMAHVPHGDPRRVVQRFPNEGEGRCTARTLDGKRCRQWAMRDDDLGGKGNGLCKLHAYPERHSQLQHGYFRRRPFFGEAMQAYVAEQATEGEPLAGELVVVRLKLRGVMTYLAVQDLTNRERVRATSLLLQGSGTVARILETQKGLGEMDWGEGTGGGARTVVERVLGSGD